MLIEKERKYLLKYLPVYDSTIEIEQGYLFYDDNVNFRVRIIDNKLAFITYKSNISTGINNEFEYEIPLLDGIELMNLSKIKLKKTRHLIGDNIVIDVYNINNHIVSVVEIEYNNESELDNLPDFVGKEVTGNKMYSNISMARLQSNKEI